MGPGRWDFPLKLQSPLQNEGACTCNAVRLFITPAEVGSVLVMQERRQRCSKATPAACCQFPAVAFGLTEAAFRYFARGKQIIVFHLWLIHPWVLSYVESHLLLCHYVTRSLQRVIQDPSIQYPRRCENYLARLWVGHQPQGCRNLGEKSTAACTVCQSYPTNLQAAAWSQLFLELDSASLEVSCKSALQLLLAGLKPQRKPIQYVKSSCVRKDKVWSALPV